ncbi:MAG: hypothetical protein ACKPE3_12880, partial [Sphaerospermopsis kisseleviana]
LADPPGFLPSLWFAKKKKIWEDSPDEGGDSVAATVEIHTVIKTTMAKSLTPYCWERTYPIYRILQMAASEVGSYQGQKA